MIVKLKGKPYELELTVGAILDYEKETGNKLSELGENDISGIFELIYCCLRSTARRNGTTLDLNKQQIFDFIDVSDIPDLVTEFSEELKNAFEKKMPRKERRQAARVKK